MIYSRPALNVNAETINLTISKTGRVLCFTNVNMVKKRHEVLKRKPVSNRPKKLRQWSKESMAKALDAVASGKMGVNRAAIEFNVPCMSLKD